MAGSGPLDIVVDVAKLPAHGQDVSGDTVEVIERPAGGVSLVLADGEGTGPAAKAVSTFVAHRAIEEIANGTKDGVTARAVHDALWASRGGKATSTLVILSADIPARTVVVSRNSNGPVLVRTPREILVYEEDVPLLGATRALKPNIYTVEMLAGTLVIALSQGVVNAGGTRGAAWTTKDIVTAVEDALASGTVPVARALLEAAVAADGGRPHDDMAVVMLAVEPGVEGACTRTMTVHLPV